MFRSLTANHDCPQSLSKCTVFIDTGTVDGLSCASFDSTVPPRECVLLSYYLVINLAVAAINFVKPWKLLHQLAFVATGLIAGSYISIYAKPEQYAVLDQILWLHIGLFIWLSIRYSQLIKKNI